MKVPEILVVRSRHEAGSLAKILTVIGESGVVVEGLKAIRRDFRTSTWEITLEPDHEFSIDPVVAAIDALPNAEVEGRSDRVFNRHRGGKLKVSSTLPIKTDEMLRDLYTPGVARVCMAIQEDARQSWDLTSIGKTVAIVTDGSAVLGLGNIGPVAGAPVMEGKAALMAELVGLNGVPILIDRHSPEEIVDAVAAIAPSFGAIQLEDIKAPECFAIEEMLRDRLNIPVMHDDQHGTAVVTLAAILSATSLTELQLRDCTVGQVGLGAAGIGIARLLLRYGVRAVVGADLDPGAVERFETLGGRGATLEEVMRESDVVVATTGVHRLIKPEMVHEGQIILALSNPLPEISPEEAIKHGAAFAADGKVVNNVLGFPGLFKGALEAKARKITDRMLIAAAETISLLRIEGGLVPHALDRTVHEKVAEAVAAAAVR